MLCSNYHFKSLNLICNNYFLKACTCRAKKIATTKNNMPFVFHVRWCSASVEGASSTKLSHAQAQLNNYLRRRRVEFINFIPQACKVSHRHFLYIKDFWTVKQNGYILIGGFTLLLSVIAQGFEVRLAGMISKASVKMCRCFHTCWMTRFNNYVPD